jgi:hypothetical protein
LFVFPEGPCSVLRRARGRLAADGAVCGDAALWDGFAGVRPPLVDLHRARLDEVQGGEEAGHLIAGAQRC